MRILANENFPLGAIISLRLNGHDVVWIRDDIPGSSDIQVLEQAQNENRILITFDKDFGELAFRFGLPATCGIILFRISTPSSEDIARVAMAGHFYVVDDTQIRMTPLPTSNV